MKKPLFTLAILAAFSTAQAQSPAPVNTIAGFVGMTATAGGDKLVTVEYTDGDNVDIRAGGGFMFTAGIDYQVNPQFSVQGSLNFHTDRANAKNGNVKFQRFPVEGLVFYHPGNNWKFGGGLRYVASPRLSGKIAGYSGDFSFKNTLSAVLETEYLYSPQTSIKMRYVNEKFDAKDLPASASANHFGVSINYYF
jgi:hypothetical protein